MAEVKESLRALYLDNDSSSFQHLLGFTEAVGVFNEDEFNTDVEEVNVTKENRPDDLKDDAKDDLHHKIRNINNVNVNTVTKSEESANNKSENQFDTGTLQCSLCEFKCNDGEALKQHKLAFHREEEKCAQKSTPGLKNLRKSLDCAKCDTKFRHGGAFRRHKFIKHGENEEEVEKEWKALQQNFGWSCETCGKKFLDQHNMRVHTKREHSAKGKVDKEERKKFREERRRIRLRRRVVCEHCSTSVLAKSLRMHIKAHQRKNFAPQQDFNCTMCFTRLGKFRSEDALERHMFNFHSGLVYHCEFCDNTSTTPPEKRRHIRAKHKARTVQCNECEKRFVGEGDLRAHIKARHEKVKDKQCPHCGEAFQAGRAFTAHVNRHTDNRQFSCETCGKSFLVESHLKEHTKSHTLPYFCDECDSRFGSHESMKAHRRIVHEQEQIECRHGCGWKCWQIANRGRHEKSCRQSC